jgi:hypothetical protein
VSENMKSNDMKRVTPRKPIILRRVPDSYYHDHQLAGVIQAVETSLFSFCFKQFPQAFSTLYSGLEKLCKNISGDKKDVLFFRSWEAAGRKLNLEEHYLFEKIELDGKPRYKFQNEWATLRNEIEHQGDSPSYDKPTARLILGSLWDAYELLFNRGYGFDLNEAMLPNTVNALNCSRSVLSDLERGGQQLDSINFVDPLVHHMRHLMSPTFNLIENFMDYDESDLHWQHMNARQEEIKNHRKELDWETIDCPCCDSSYSMFGFTARNEDPLEIHFSIFACPECNLVTRNHAIQPHLAKRLLELRLENHIVRIAGAFGEETARLVW